MRHVSVSTTDTNPRFTEKRYHYNAEALDDAPSRLPIQVQNTGLLFGRSLEQVAFSIELHRSQNDVLHWIKDARDCGVGMFQAAMHPGELVPIVFRGQTVEVKGACHEFVKGPAWVRTWGVAHVLRDTAALDALCSFDTGRFFAPGAAFPEFYLSFVEALKAFHRGEPWEDFLDDAVAGRQHHRPQSVVQTSAAWHRMLEAFSPTLPLPMEEYFNNALYDALVAHGKQHKRNDHRREHRLDFVSLGFAALAHDRGIPIEVESDYIPDWLYKGTWRDAQEA